MPPARVRGVLLLYGTCTSALTSSKFSVCQKRQVQNARSVGRPYLNCASQGPKSIPEDDRLARFGGEAAIISKWLIITKC